MHKYLFLIVFIFSIFSIYPQTKEFDGNLTIGLLKDVPPISFMDKNGEPSGIFTDLIIETARLNGWTIHWIYQPFPILFQMIEESRIDILPGLIKTIERQEFIKFNDIAIFTSWTQAFVSPGETKIENILDIDGLTVGLMEKDQNGIEFIKLANSFKLKYKTVYYSNYNDLTNAVLKKDVNVGIYNNLYALGDNELSATNIIFSPNDSFYGVPIENKELYPVLNIIDEQIVEWKKDQNSYYYQIYDKYFKTLEKNIVPKWIYYLIISAFITTFMLLLWSRILKQRVLKQSKELIEKDTSFRNLFELTPQSTLYFTKDLVITNVNTAAEKMFKIKREESIGKSLKQVIDENKLIFVDENEKEIHLQDIGISKVFFDKKTTSKVIGFKSINNSDYIWIIETVTPELDKNGDIKNIYSILNDITELKTALNSIEEKEKESQDIIENMNSGFAYHKMIYDENNEPYDYEYIQVNNKFKELTGMKDPIGKTLRQLTPKIVDDDINWIKLYGNIVKSKRSRKIESYSNAIDKWFDISTYSPKPNHFVSIFDDITNRKTSEDILKSSEIALKENQKRLSTTFESIGDGVITVDKNLKVTMMNRVAKEIILYWDTGYYGMDLDQILKLEQINIGGKSIKEIASDVLESKKPYYINNSILHIESLGIDKVIEDSIAPIYDNNEIYGLVIVFRDITDKINIEKKNQELEHQLIQSQKMDSIGQFSGGIAHNFNNILTAINGYINIIENDIESNEREFNYLDEINEIKKASKRASDLTSKLLTVSKRQNTNPDILDINFILGDMVSMMKSIAGENITINTKLECKNVIKADQNQIEQIILNFIANSRDALIDKDGDKKILIETFDYYVTKDYSKQNFEVEEGQYVVLSFSDNGSGIPNDIKNKIFDPFFTTKEKGKGTGLGLSTVYGIVKQNNAAIHVYSEENNGTVFKIFWPISFESKKVITKNKVKPSSLKGNEKILFVEDESSLQDLAKKFLTGLGYKVIIASDGQEGLGVLNGSRSEIDIVVTDVIMPKMSGIELYKEIKKVNPTLKVLFTSGYTKDHIIEFEDEVNFISKPYSLKSLTQKIREILDN